MGRFDEIAGLTEATPGELRKARFMAVLKRKRAVEAAARRRKTAWQAGKKQESVGRFDELAGLNEG